MQSTKEDGVDEINSLQQNFLRSMLILVYWDCHEEKAICITTMLWGRSEFWSKILLSPSFETGLVCIVVHIQIMGLILLLQKISPQPVVTKLENNNRRKDKDNEPKSSVHICITFPYHYMLLLSS